MSVFEHRSIEELFAQSDFISLHCSLSPDSKRMVNCALLQRMKPSAFLINTARGALIKEDDLAAALICGDLAGAALDVLSSEPPDSSNPLLHAPNCIITPHIAWASLPARQRIMQATANNLNAFLAGAPVNLVS